MKILCPFKILWKEKTYLFWPISILIFSFSNVLAEMLNGVENSIENAFLGGQVYLFSLSICAPFVTTLALNIIVKKRNRAACTCITIKMISTVLNVFFIFVNVSLWSGLRKDNIIIQIIILVITIIFSTYMFCIQELDNHPDILKECDDETYLDKENTRKNKTSEKEAALSGVGGIKL